MCKAVHGLRNIVVDVNQRVTELIADLDECVTCGRAHLDVEAIRARLKEIGMLTAVPHDRRRDGPLRERTAEVIAASAKPRLTPEQRALLDKGELPLIVREPVTA